MTNIQKKRIQKKHQEKAEQMGGVSPHIIENATCATFTTDDNGNADRLCYRFGDLLAFAGKKAGWIAWDGRRWDTEDGETAALSYASETARKIRFEPPHLPKTGKEKEDKQRAEAHAKWANTSGKANSLRGMLTVAQPTLLTDINDFNDPEKTGHPLNAMNGTIDLRTGRLQRNNPKDKITSLAKIEYDPEAKAPRWERFLKEVFMDDQEMIDFVQRAVGYSFFGVQYESVVFFLLGDERATDKNGANGKSVFLKILKNILGDYAEAIDPALIVKRDNRGIPNDVAKLWRVRVGMGSEFDRSDVIDEARLKRLTGDDPIEARFLHKEHYTFTSGATLFYTANHAPLIQSTDNGIWRWPILIPFKQRFYKPEECENGQPPEGGLLVDRTLWPTLLKERKGILNWYVKGAVEYMNRGGLDTPARLFLERDRRRAETDPLFDWAQTCLKRDPEATCSAKDLFDSYQGFFRENAMMGISQNAFGRRLTEMGIEKDEKESRRQNKAIRRGAKLTHAGVSYKHGHDIPVNGPDLRAVGT